MSVIIYTADPATRREYALPDGTRALLMSDGSPAILPEDLAVVMPDAASAPPPPAPSIAAVLTAEQLVRGAAFVLARIVNAGRHHSEMVRDDLLTLDLADAIGVDLPTEPDGCGGENLLPYGYRRSSKEANAR